ncbi:TIGR01244 family sulfur transferase [Qipengyuania atrilutea]|uniref:TIGR01244 family phosphatase n=1 Tax=Qipengyuania atrilutea TaxID=2744473 RepID=A0A850H376_9SPHN|nr:TIGR01244 family sulfur transferase [Actirhodobacter atriluteus]NVD44652.1 TIGR01244 family phosphatase [Actirhodobacter atriluteus]
MSEFRRVTDNLYVSPQIGADDIENARRSGFTGIVNNRPDGESDDQTPGEAIRAAAERAGLAYTAIPIGQDGIAPSDIESMRAATDPGLGNVLAYCRSGTRSTLLWSLAEASRGTPPAAIERAAAEAGYSIAPVRGAIEQLAADAEK